MKNKWKKISALIMIVSALGIVFSNVNILLNNNNSMETIAAISLIGLGIGTVLFYGIK